MSLWHTGARPGRNSNQTLRLARAVPYYYLPGGWAIWNQVTGDPQTHADLAPLFHSRCAILLDGHWAADFLCAASVRAIFLDVSPVIDGAHRHERRGKGTRSSTEREQALAETKRYAGGGRRKTRRS